MTIAVMMMFVFDSECYSQERYILKHTQSSDRGIFSVTQKSSEKTKKKIKINEISLSVSGTTGRTVNAAADITVEETQEVPKNIRTAIKSYANPEFERKVEYKDKGEGSGEYEEHIEDISEESVPVKLYLEVSAGGEITTYDFWDKNDLESIVSGVNSEFGANLEVVGEGRSVSVRNASFDKKIEKKTVSERFYASKIQIEQGNIVSIFKFDVVKLEKELISDKIMPKSGAGNFTIIIDPSDMYVNGNKIPDKLLPKYRKIMNEFSFEFDE
jgi:hypothetical protein